MTNGDLLPLAVRAYAQPLEAEGAKASAGRKQRPPRRPEPARQPSSVLVFDCETTTDATQALLFGAYRYYRLDWTAAAPALRCLEEGLFYDDQLPASEPDGFSCLQNYACSHPAAIAAGAEDAVPVLRLRSRAEFCEQVLWKALSAQATVIGYNLPFDLSRLAVDWSEARKRFAGGFSFKLFTYRDQDGVEQENRFRPRILILPLDSKRARIALGSVRPGADPDAAGRGQGSFLDLRTLAYALSGSGHSLESACQAFGIAYKKAEVEHGRITSAYVDYCRADVAATAALYRALASEYKRWQLQLAPTRAYSPASLAKAQLREAGIRPLLQRQPDFPPAVLGQSMIAYYGGRAEARIRRTPVRVVYLDFASMYPTVCSLLGLSRFLGCSRVDLVDGDPARVERRIARLGLNGWFEPKRWHGLCGFALVQPNGDVLPVRARHSVGRSYGIGANPLSSEEPLWYALADVAAAKLLTGRTPRLLRVVSLRPAGKARGLRPLRVRGSRPIDPASEDVFRAMVEERRRLEQIGDPESRRTSAALKTVASAASYGIHLELNRHEPTAERVSVRVHGLDSFNSSITAIEEPGSYFYPPPAALVTAGARLMLALLERCVTDACGSYAFCDTDSMAIVATESGALVPCVGGTERDEHGREYVRALSWRDVDGIVDRFASLNPYDRSLVPGSILELERENYDLRTGKRRQVHCYAISAKRYCLYTLDDHGEPGLVKWSEHALGGFYLNPTDPVAGDRNWVRESWDWILRDALGLSTPEPAWLDRAALTQFTATHPRLLRPFAELNAGKPYREQVKPFNFLLVAHVAAGGYPAGVDGKHFALLAPYETDPRRWQALPWRNVYDPNGPSYTLDTETLISRRGLPSPRGVVGIKSYRDVLNAYRLHPEAKSLGPDGKPCGRRTVGLLQRRPVQALTITHIGKETNLLDEIQAGLVGEESNVLVEYTDPTHDLWDTLVRPVLGTMPQQKTATAAGIHRDTLADITSGRSRPHSTTQRRLRKLAVEHAREALTSRSRAPMRADDACLRAYLDGSDSASVRVS